ncbi:hypothetical protein [Actinomadura hibisca]|uniref:hypothetical protein n=1 Tax=Actinomadura hibisca TaxID=68565 RepID=UPI000835D862|nr:hypothetical protein [Actinomadura hibisca]
MWPDIVEAVKRKSRVAWMVIMSGVQPVSLDRNLLTLAFDAEGKRTNFTNGGRDVVLREVLKERMGVDWRIDTVLAGAMPPPARPAGRPGGGAPTGGGGYGSPAPAPTPSTPPQPPQNQNTTSGYNSQNAAPTNNPAAGFSGAAEQVPSRPSSAGPRPSGPPDMPAPPPPDDPGPPPPPDDLPPPPEPAPVDESDDVDPLGDRDADGTEAEASGMALIQRELGGQIIREIDNT